MSLGNSLGQLQVNVQPASAVAGDFASTNPRSAVLAGPGGLSAGLLGCFAGRMAWITNALVDADDAPAAVNNFGSGNVAGFIHREQQGMITDYLQVFSMKVPAGFPVTVMASGDFWCVNDGATAALPGMKAYARYADGKIVFAATATPPTASATGSIAAGAGATVTGSITDNILTVTAGTGLVIGGVLTGSGVATGTAIVSQLTGAAGTIGTYTVSIGEQTVASTAISETWGVFTAASVLVGLFGVGDTLTGSGVSAGTVITALGTGTGGLGTYIVNLTQTAGSTTITAATAIETKWFARSTAAAGELVKISSTTLG